MQKFLLPRASASRPPIRVIPASSRHQGARNTSLFWLHADFTALCHFKVSPIVSHFNTSNAFGPTRLDLCAGCVLLQQLLELLAEAGGEQQRSFAGIKLEPPRLCPIATKYLGAAIHSQRLERNSRALTQVKHKCQSSLRSCRNAEEPLCSHATCQASNRSTETCTCLRQSMWRGFRPRPELLAGLDLCLCNSALRVAMTTEAGATPSNAGGLRG